MPLYGQIPNRVCLQVNRRKMAFIDLRWDAVTTIEQSGLVDVPKGCINYTPLIYHYSPQILRGCYQYFANTSNAFSYYKIPAQMQNCPIANKEESDWKERHELFILRKYYESIDETRDSQSGKATTSGF